MPVVEAKEINDSQDVKNRIKRLSLRSYRKISYSEKFAK